MTGVRLVVMAASTGGLEAISQVLGGLAADFPAAVAVVLHRSVRDREVLPEILAWRTALQVRLATAGATIEPGTVYVAPADAHLRIEAPGIFALTRGPQLRYVGSSADALMASAAEVLGGGVVAIVLTGRGTDGAAGVAMVRQAGGVVIVQDDRTSEAEGMPAAAIATGAADWVLPLDEIAPRLVMLAAAQRAG
jgi:two-component system, chemotaxis family, protein-glutamate methylesterase/glutaminase